jgi:anti-sigma regulatory factor (Ser/Thr protein kinase)
MAEVLSHIASICELSGLTHDEQLKVELAIEELFTNTIRHGYGQDCDEPVWISADNSGKNLCITYQDIAPAFNPLERPIERIPPPLGGLGVTLVENFADTRYHHENGRNTLILTFTPAPG